MSASRYAVVRRLSRVFLMPLHGHNIISNNRMRRRQGKDPTSTADQRIFTKENCLTCCKKFTAFMFSRVGLFLVMIGYVALGGLLFQALEAGNENDMRRVMGAELDSTLLKLWNEYLRVNSFSFEDKRGNFSLYATRELEKFETTVKTQVQQGFDGRLDDANNDWNYFGAVLYAVTLVSTIGYGHITTKTTQGKIATILYSAFGVPLMMLFVANIGSTMAKMFAFLFSRITMIFCCRMSNKKKRALAFKNRQKLVEKSNQIDGKLPMTITKEIPTKSNLETIKDENIKDSNSSRQTNSAIDIRTSHLPADIRLDMLTGVPNRNTSRSLTSSINSVGERSKDAIIRINELIRRNSVEDNLEILNDERKRRRSVDISPIQYYIDQTNKLTNNLDSSTHEKSSVLTEKEETNQDENNMKQVVLPEDTSNTIDDANNKESKKKSSKKNLKRSKSESTHNRRLNKKVATDSSSNNDNVSITKPPRRRFFSRKNGKLKKQMTVEDDKTNKNVSSSAIEVRQINETNKNLNDQSHRLLPPPPDYEQSTTNEITPAATTVTWKSEDQFHPSKTTFDLTNLDFEDEEDFDDEEEMSVPLLVTVFIIPLYLTLGAILFNIWENWGFLNSFYFCFITLTTIGFGDFVPGSALNAEAEKEKLISAALYILLGLVLIAMSVNLMKEQLSQKVKRVASKLGNF